MLQPGMRLAKQKEAGKAEGTGPSRAEAWWHLPCENPHPAQGPLWGLDSAQCPPAQGTLAGRRTPPHQRCGAWASTLSDSATCRELEFDRFQLEFSLPRGGVRNTYGWRCFWTEFVALGVPGTPEPAPDTLPDESRRRRVQHRDVRAARERQD